MFVYFLIDNGLLQEVSAGYSEDDVKSRPEWLEPLYSERALEVSPLLVDIESAYEEGALDQVMGYLNACKPALHVSIIETSLDLKQIAQHLRRFIFILDSAGKQFTLRYGDCAVLAVLPSILNPEQWAAMSLPISQWNICNRSGAIVRLPLNHFTSSTPTPICLEQDQLDALEESSEPDHFVAKVRMMHHGADFPGSAADQYTWACAARQIWRAANNSNELCLTFLTEAAIFTRGNILRRQAIQEFLAIEKAGIFRERLQELVRQMSSI
ncbi:DUF4123 domain-containing protein [Massilia sp. YIM B02443]|uniref:DUF4123 domain-containing protein n=1 Tax=Massilia sp. YIM B02443 TaxID=3050127 RepID=UPI0025B6B10C|nr:DUF4123 domain-containing protein [Massilia sp. YIM B02443]MDN4036294.1 DUF4123 domain-containing protein [Massilia sp. YIM B02443]